MNFGCVARRGVGQSLGKAAIVSMYLLDFDAACIPTQHGGHCAASEELTMMNLILLTQVCVGAVVFATLLGQILVRRHLDLVKWHKAMWALLTTQVAITVITAFAVVGFGEQVELPTVLLMITNTAWMCTVNLFLTLAIPICHMKR